MATTTNNDQQQQKTSNTTKHHNWICLSDVEYTIPQLYAVVWYMVLCEFNEIWAFYPTILNDILAMLSFLFFCFGEHFIRISLFSVNIYSNHFVEWDLVSVAN